MTELNQKSLSEFVSESRDVYVAAMAPGRDLIREYAIAMNAAYLEGVNAALVHHNNVLKRLNGQKS